MWARLVAWFKERRRKRRWNAELQLYYLRQQVREDRDWMGHDPKVKALCDRYMAMLADDWEKQTRLSVSDFRDSIGCNPHRK